MLINEVDAIPQRNCLNLSDLKKRRGSTQANTATKLYTLDAFRGKNAQYTQQNTIMKKGHKYGTHRVISPKGVLPQPADKLDNNRTRDLGSDRR